MRIKATAIVLSFMTCSSSQAEMFSELSLFPGYSVEKQELTSKLTHLRDHGGFTDFKPIACVSPDKYDEYLRATWGEANFYPTSSECWKTGYLEKVKATGRCTDVGFNRTNLQSTYSVLVCEFSFGWLSQDAWLAVKDVRISSDPAAK